MQEFTFYLPTKVYFGEGAIKKVGEARKLGERVISRIQGLIFQLGLPRDLSERDK